MADSAPSAVLAGAGDVLPPVLAAVDRKDVDTAAAADGVVFPEPSPESPALIVYTSGTTGPPKGAILPRRAIAASLDALADAWQWTGDDVLVHALPLFHVHGLILGVLGPLRLGGSVRHLGRFSTEGVARELSSGATMLFGVPTMYHRIAEALGTAAPAAAELAEALTGARLLVSGSAALPVHDHERIAAATGRRVIERYGMTETLMNTGIRADGEPRPGTVGAPLRGVELRLVEEDGTPLDDPTAEGAVGEIQVRGPNLFMRLSEPPRRDGGRLRRGRLVPHRRHGRPRRRRLCTDRRPQGHRPDQERRLQDRCGRDRERAAGPPERPRGRRHRGAGPGSGRADRRLGGRRPTRPHRPRRPSSRTMWRPSWPRTSAPAQSVIWRRCHATTWARS